MARNLDTDLRNALNDTVIRPLFLVEVNTPSGAYRFCSGQGSFYWSGSPLLEWLGVGNLGSITAITETRDVRAEGIKLRLSGIPSAMVTLVLADAVPGYEVNVWIAMLTEANVLMGEPYQAFSGELDAVSEIESGETSTIEIAVESELIRLQRANESRYTHEQQIARFPGDLGFEYVEALQDYNIQFGPQGNNVPTSPKLVSRR